MSCAHGAVYMLATRSGVNQQHNTLGYESPPFTVRFLSRNRSEPTHSLAKYPTAIHNINTEQTLELLPSQSLGVSFSSLVSEDIRSLDCRGNQPVQVC